MSQSLDRAREETSFGRVGDAVGQILRLAEAEAAQLREDARAEADAILFDGKEAALALRADADKYAEDKRAVISREAARIMVQTNRVADELLADADAKAIARTKHAEQACDKLREDAAAELAQLAARREQVERILQERTALARQRAVEARELERTLLLIDENIAQSRLVGDVSVSMARQAEGVLADARTEAALVRARARGALNEALQRRNTIHRHVAELGRLLIAASDTSERHGSPRLVSARARRSRPGQPRRYNWAIAGARRPGPDESVGPDC
jgi:hypothetical protein